MPVLLQPFYALRFGFFGGGLGVARVCFGLLGLLFFYSCALGCLHCLQLFALGFFLGGLGFGGLLVGLLLGLPCFLFCDFGG
jgi:hypothetical protein